MGQIGEESFKEADGMCMKGYAMFWRQQTIEYVMGRRNYCLVLWDGGRQCMRQRQRAKVGVEVIRRGLICADGELTCYRAGGGWFTIFYYRKDSPFLSLEVPPPTPPPPAHLPSLKCPPLEERRLSMPGLVKRKGIIYLKVTQT